MAPARAPGPSFTFTVALLVAVPWSIAGCDAGHGFGAPNRPAQPLIQRVVDQGEASAADLKAAGIGGRLLYVEHDDAYPQAAYLVDAATGQTQELWRTPDKLTMHGAVSAGGTHLTFAEWESLGGTPSEVIRRSLDAGAAREVLTTVPGTVAGLAGVVATTASDGIAYGVQRTGSAAGDAPVFELHLTEASGEGVQGGGVRQDRIVWRAPISDPAESPELAAAARRVSFELIGWDLASGQALVVREVSNPISGGVASVTISRQRIDVASGLVVDKVPEIDTFAAPSPDGRWVASREVHDLELINLATGAIETVAHGGSTSIDTITWSSDSRWLAWAESFDGQRTMTRVRPVDPNLDQPAIPPDLEGAPLAINPSGDWLLVGHASPSAENWQKLTVHALRGVEQTHTLPWVPGRTHNIAMELHWLP